MVRIEHSDLAAGTLKFVLADVARSMRAQRDAELTTEAERTRLNFQLAVVQDTHDQIEAQLPPVAS